MKQNNSTELLGVTFIKFYSKSGPPHSTQTPKLKLVEGILGIATFFLREDLLVEWRAMLKQFMGELKGDAAPRVCLLWGKYDVVVPFEHAKETYTKSCIGAL